MTIQWLLNVKLEKSFDIEDGEIRGTKTELCHLKIEDGKITDITNQLPDTHELSIDGQGYLLLPSLKDMHIHIDKTYYGGPWKACTPITNGIFTRLDEEKSYYQSCYQQHKNVLKK